MLHHPSPPRPWKKSEKPLGHTDALHLRMLGATQPPGTSGSEFAQVRSRTCVSREPRKIFVPDVRMCEERVARKRVNSSMP